VLFATNDEWMSRSVGTVFEERNFSVVRAASGTLALSIARRVRPDVVLLDDSPAGLDAVSVCRALRDDPLFDPSTPVVVTSPAHLGPSTRDAAYEAGAWEYCSQPLDVEQLLLKLKTFLRARQELIRARARQCHESSTGLYTLFGIEQVSYHLRAQAARERGTVACVTLMIESADGTDATPHHEGRSDFEDVANICRLHSRKSDFIGHAGPERLAILAPGTDAGGARDMVARLQRALDDAARAGIAAGGQRLRAGYCAIADQPDAKLEPADLVGRATAALEFLRDSGSADFIAGFEQITRA
jgi:DNA-binding response OmpR family regulator